MQQVSNCQYIFGNCAANNESTEEIQQHQDLQKPQLMGYQDEYLSESTNVFEQQLNLFEEYVNEQLFSGKINVKTIPADDNSQQILDLIQPKIEEKVAEQEWNNELNGVGFNQSIFQNNFYNSNQQNLLISTFQNGHDNNFQFQISQFNFQNENFFLNECPQPKFENPSLFYQENQFLNLPIPQQSNSQNCQIINNNQSQPQQYQQTQQQQPQQYQQTQQYQQQQAQQSLQIQQQQPQQYQQAQLQFEQVQQKNYQYLQQDLQQNNFQQEITFNQFQPAPPKQEINNAIFETKLETNSDDGQETEQNSQEKQTSQDCQQKSSQQNKKYLFDNNSNKLKNFYKTILKPLIESLKKVYQQQNRDDVIEFIKIAFPISCNQKHFLLLFPHLQEICNMQKKTTIVQEFEQKLNFNSEQLQILSEIRKQAARLFSKKFYYFTRIFKSHAASKNIEEFYYGCLFYSERQHQEQYTPEGSNYMKPERILNPVQSNLRQRLYQIQSSKLQQQYNQNQNIQQIQQRILFY